MATAQTTHATDTGGEIRALSQFQEGIRTRKDDGICGHAPFSVGPLLD